MFEYLKYLPLMQVASDHPKLVEAFNQIMTIVQPLIPEIEQAVDEAEAIIRQIDPPTR